MSSRVPSKIVLVTFFNPSVDISLGVLFQEFSKFGKIAKIVLFQKRNFQAFLEFVEPQAASRFRAILHNTHYKKMFFMKMQLTHKTHLRINPSSPFEKSFLNEKSQKELPFVSSVCSSEREGSFFLLLKSLSREVKHKSLFNLFSIYGVILRIGIDADSHRGFIVFTNRRSIEEAFECLQDESLFGQNLDISLSTELREEEFEVVNYLKENKSQGRFDRPKKGLRPSNVLYIYNLNSELGLQAVRNLFETIEEMVEINYTEDSQSSGKVHFKSKDAATKVLCYFKNVKLMNKTIKITFAEPQ